MQRALDNRYVCTMPLQFILNVLLAMGRHAEGLWGHAEGTRQLVCLHMPLQSIPTVFLAMGGHAEELWYDRPEGL